jgi:methyltransferase (TIGR00027 family)
MLRRTRGGRKPTFGPAKLGIGRQTKGRTPRNGHDRPIIWSALPQATGAPLREDSPAMKPISNTAFYCCGIRMRDAQSARPVCADLYAKRFMDERGLKIFRQFGGESSANISNVARHRYIDDFLRRELAGHPQLQVIVIGCGFDSRAFRLSGGTWLELDEPQLIAYKNDALPASESPNPLQRIAIDFGSESLAQKLQPFSGSAPTVFVIEGVAMYLPIESLRATLLTLGSLFPGNRVIADLMTAHFINRYGANIKRTIAALGAQMIPPDTPAQPFQEAGYRELSRASVVGMGFRYRSLGPLNVLLRPLLPRLFSGYTLRVFRHIT